MTLKLKQKNDSKNSKNISRTFSGVLVGSVGSVHFQIVPWASLYFSRSIDSFLCSRYSNYTMALSHCRVMDIFTYLNLPFITL